MTEPITRLEARLLDTVRAAAHEPGALPAALGLSGGRDSLLLAEALHRLGVAFEAWHFNHRWRGAASRSDAAWVRRWCRTRAIPYVGGSAPAALPANEGAARAARWAFFQRSAARRGIACLWLAHHADDRAETLLLQLTRGAGPGGLAGPRGARFIGPLRVLRPLTTFRRAEITRLARHWRLEWLDDPTNLDPRHRRNALRLRGLPYLSRWAGRDVVPILARTADILETEEEYWQSILPVTWPAELPLRTLRSQHPAWQRRALMAWLASRGVTDPTFEQIEAIRAMLYQPSPARINLSRNRFCRRRAGCFFIE